MSEIVRYSKPKKCQASEKANIALTTIKIDIFREYPFLGFLIMSTEYQFTKDLPTMAATTIPNNIVYINEEFLLNGLPTRAERSFVLVHEILHIFLDHIGRAIERNYHKKLWNYATDYCINGYETDLNSKLLVRPKSALFEEKYKGMSADEIYHKLLEESDGSPEKALEKLGEPSNGIGGDYSDGVQRPFDEVSDEEVSEEKRADNKQKVAAAMSQSNMEDIKNMGKGAAGMIREFEDMLESVIPWNDVLRDYITTKSAEYYTYNKASRRSTKSVIFPRLDGNYVDLFFGVDTSGSMSDKDIKEALGELAGICEEIDQWRITFASCDTEAHILGEYSSEEGDEFSTITKAMVGGGGTDMTPMVEYANEMEEPPSVTIILTDGYIPEASLDESVTEDNPVIVVVTENGNPDLKLNNCMVLFMKDKAKK